MGLLIPNSTQVPNFLLDELLPTVDSAEWKVIAFVCRKTYGWQKREDRISLSQFERGTGLSRAWLVKILARLTGSGLLLKTGSKRGDIYSLNLEYANTGKLNLLVNAVNHPSRSTQLTKSGELSFESGKLALPTKQTIQNQRNLESSRSDERTSDPRHQPIREHIKKKHSQVNGMRLEIVPWEAAEGSALKKFLNTNPKLTIEEVFRCVDHYYESDVNISERPRKWIPRLMEFWIDSVNQYKTPNVFDKENQREARLRREATVGQHN